VRIISIEAQPIVAVDLMRQGVLGNVQEAQKIAKEAMHLPFKY